MISHPRYHLFLLLSTTFQFNPAVLFSSSFLLIYLYPSTTSYQQQFWPFYSMGQTQTQWIHSIHAWVMWSWIIWDKAKSNFWLATMRTHPDWALLCAMGLLQVILSFQITYLKPFCSTNVSRLSVSKMKKSKT